MHPFPTAFPDFGLTPEQRHEAVFGHYYEHQGMDGERGEIWCYTPRLAYRNGETVTLHVSATAKSFRVEIVRDGATETPVLSIDNQSGALSGRARPMLGRGLRLGCDAGIHRRPGMAVRRLPHHGDCRRPRRQADLVRPSDHRQAGRRQQARPHPAGRGNRHLDGLQYLGRLQPLPGHHRAEARPVRDDRQHRAPAGPRLRAPAAGGAARAAGDLAAAADGAALPAHGMGLRHRPFQEIHLVRLGELRQPSVPLGRARRLCDRSRQPARTAFRAGASRRL